MGRVLFGIGMLWLAAAGIAFSACAKDERLSGGGDGRRSLVAADLASHQPISLQSADANSSGRGTRATDTPAAPEGRRDREGRRNPTRTTAEQGTQASPAAAPDPGAVEVVRAMKAALGFAEDAPAGTAIALRNFRNQSRTRQPEIDDLRDRLLVLLNRAGEAEGIRFTRDVTDSTEYTLGGTVYLIQQSGFDQWEVYFSLRPVDANWALWRNESPVRTFRQKRSLGDGLVLVREE